MVLTQSARKHKVGVAHMAHVIMTTTPVATENERSELHLSWVGPDDRGIELEVAAVLIPDRRSDNEGPILLVLHAMPTALRRRR